MKIHSVLANVVGLSCSLWLLHTTPVVVEAAQQQLRRGHNANPHHRTLTVQGQACDNNSALDIAGLKDQFDEFIKSDYESAITIVDDIQDKLDVTLPLLGESFDGFIGDIPQNLQSMYGDLKTFVTNFETSLGEDTCYTESVTITTCDDDEMEIVFDIDEESLRITLCPSISLSSPSIELNPTGLFDALDESYELDTNGATIDVDIELGFDASVTFSLDADTKRPVFSEIVFDSPFTAAITVDGQADIIFALGMLDLSSTANVGFDALLSLTPPISDDDSLSFDATAGYNLNGIVSVAVDVEGIDDLAADAQFSIVEADIYNPNPVVNVDAPDLMDLVKLSPKSAVTMLHVVDSALVRAQENKLFEVNVPITDKKLTEILATGSVLTNR